MVAYSQWFIFLFVSGLCLGSAYFLGLWLTLQRLPRSRHPFLLMTLSLLIRLTVLLGMGIWLWRSAPLPPLVMILLLSAGGWLSRMILIARLSTAVKPASVHFAVRR